MRNIKVILSNSVFEDGSFDLSWRGGRMPMAEKEPIKFIDRIERPWSHDQRFILEVNGGSGVRYTILVNERWDGKGTTKITKSISGLFPHWVGGIFYEEQKINAYNPGTKWLDDIFNHIRNSIGTFQYHKEYNVEILEERRRLMHESQKDFMQTREGKSFVPGRDFSERTNKINQWFDSLIKEWVHLSENPHLLLDCTNIDSWKIEPLPQPLAYVSAKGF